MSCSCTEEWYPIPPCEGQSQEGYGYALWVRPDCVQHTEHLASMQKMIKELRNELD